MIGDRLDPVCEDLPAPDQHTFVIRTWVSGAPDGVRGHVQHLRSRQSAYFVDRQRLQTFIEEHLRLAQAASGDNACPR